MKKKTKSRLSNILFSASCLCVCFVFIWLFWRDLNKTSVRNDKTQIATIYFKRRIAQRKYSDRVVWERLSQSSPIYDKDTLRIAKGAQARLKFKSNAELKIDENTMLQLFSDKDGRVSINLSDGDVSIDTTASQGESLISVKMDDGSLMKISSGAKMTASKNSSDDNFFNIQAGSVQVYKSDGSVENLKNGSAVKISKNGEIEQKPLCVTSIGKNFDFLAFENENNSVTLKWITSENQKNSPVKVETSYDENFSEIEQSFETQDENSVVINPQRSVYWRVYAEGNENEAERGKINVEKVNDIELLSPAGNSVFEYQKNAPKIYFSWEGNDFVSYYDFSVMKADDLLNPVFQKKVLDKNISVDLLLEGNYVWRVTPFYEINGIGEKKSSDDGIFRIVRKNEITPVTLTVPAENARILFDENSENSKKVSFLWKSDVENAAYNLLISDSEDFSNVVYENSTESTRLIKNLDELNLHEGKYYWKIDRASSEDSEETRESQIRSFTIEKNVPQTIKLLYPPENYSIEENRLFNVVFSWRLGGNQSNNQNQNQQNENVIQFSHQNDFSNIELEKTSAENSVEKINLEKGKWFWRVKNQLGNVSEANSLNILERLESPEILFPENGASVILPSSNLLNIKWKNDKNEAEYYKVKLSDNYGNEIIAKTLPSSDNEIYVNLPNLEEKNYKSFNFSIQAFSSATSVSEMRISDALAVNFSAKNPEKLALVSPVQNARIEGLFASKNSVQFIWKENDKIAENSVFFVLRKQTENGSWQILRRIRNPEKEISLQNLSPGNYQWTVEAAGFSGINLSPENSFYFTVTEIPLLSLPVLLSPADNFVIGSDFLKENRTIVFNWQKVENATDYDFVLYQKNSDGGFKKIVEQNTKKTSFRFRNLKKLDVASFEWQVTAYIHSDGNVEERHSNAAKNSFRIEFDLPQEIIIDNPGTQYGE